MIKDIVLSFDMDWAPDFMIKDILDFLIFNKCKSTWFVTHDTILLSKMREYPELFELGIHPNFMSGSSHGTNFNQVMDNIMQIVPEAISVRSHALFYCHQLLDIYLKYGIKYDSSVNLFGAPFITPVKIYSKKNYLIRVPFYWFDCNTFECDLNVGGLKIFVFHPVHIFLNSVNILKYESLKRKCGSIRHFSEELSKLYVGNGFGAKNILEELIKYPIKMIKEI